MVTMMNEKKVVLIRKQNTEFVVNYPVDDPTIPKTYIWMGTKSSVLNKKSVPFQVFEWLSTSTTTFKNGALIIEDNEDEDVQEIKSSIEGIEEVESSILTAQEISKLLKTGNHLALKKALNELTEGKSDGLVSAITKQVVNVATDEGIDSASKRQIVCEWSGLDYENSDLHFDKKTEEDLDAVSKGKSIK